MAHDVADYLFPTDLTVTPTPISKVLVIGACVAEAMLEPLRLLRPEITFDYVIFNNLAVLDRIEPEEAARYDFQYVNLPLRDVLTDQVIDFGRFLAPGSAEALAEAALERLDAFLASSLRHTVEHGLLTFVGNFLVPQGPVFGALQQRESPRDLAALVRRLNARLADLARGYRNVFVADLDAIGASLGKSTFQDDAIAFYSHAAFWTARFTEHDTSPAFHAPAEGRIEPVPHLGEIYAFEHAQFFRAVWRQIEGLYRIVHQIDPVKLVVFDLDDTLWRGQIAEHYGDPGNWPALDGWPVGIWETVQHLRARGILTAVASKNDEGLVRARWHRAVRAPWVSLDDFAFVEIGWRPKAESVAAILRGANLTAGSVVFVDDNPVEREAVRAAFPEIRTLGSNPYVTRRILLWSSETQVAFLSAESVRRETMIRQQGHRERARAGMSREDFLRDLEARVTISVVMAETDPRFARCLELINKTGERLGFAGMVAWFADGGRLYAFEVEDRYTNYGLVGAIRIQDGCFQQFAMSCRVLGLDIEDSAIRYVMRQERMTSGTFGFTAQVRETQANRVCRDVYARCGFGPSSDGDGTFVFEGGPVAMPAPHLSFIPPIPDPLPEPAKARGVWPFRRRAVS